MKICILSMQKVPNFGSLLQSYSLKKLLESLGHEVSFIDIEERKNDNCLIKGLTNSFSGEKESSLNKWGKLSKIDKYAINRLNIKIRNSIQERQFEKFRREVLQINDDDNGKQYDLCVIGSDEVFNCLADTPWGFTTQLFGNVKNAKRVITYAASCGATKYENVPEKAKERIRETFLNVNAFSVRDENTYEFVRKLTSKKIEQHYDPALIENFDEELAGCKKWEKLPEHYCIVYSYYNRIYKEEEIQAISGFYKKKKLTIVSVGAPQMWIKNHLILDPFEMLAAFQKADFIITDTFHGSIFSAKYAQRFGVIIRESNCNKLIDLLRKLNETAHIINDIKNIETIYNINNDTKKIAEFADREKIKTIKYFKEKV